MGGSLCRRQGMVMVTMLLTIPCRYATEAATHKIKLNRLIVSISGD